MAELTLGIVGTSRKPDERRLPIHPRHLDRVPEDLRRRMVVEAGYGADFGLREDELAALVGEVRPRDEVLRRPDVVLLPKPMHEDVAALPEGRVLWGWPHCVQDAELTQLALDHRLTLIAWEAMNLWSPDGTYESHVFARNNELAGYASVLHALTLRGLSGAYGRPLRAAVISFGATGRGAVAALAALGVEDVTLLVTRDPREVDAPPTVSRVLSLERAEEGAPEAVAVVDGERVPVAGVLGQHDVVVNCVLQDPDAPLVFVADDELALLPRGTLVVDVSIDVGMGFAWARPTSFAEPMVEVGEGVHYYAVDHSPSYLWDSTTWEISEALLPHLRTVLDGPDAWDRDATIRRAIEVRDGLVQNPKILSFQHRDPEPPYARRA